MIKNLSISRKVAIICGIGLIILVTVVLGISYYTLGRMAFTSDVVVHGKRISELSEEIRSELLKRSDLTTVSIPSTDNINLSGYLIQRPQPTANVLICHGYRSSKELMYAYIDMFSSWNILMFDFRAHGQSEGTITSFGCNEYKDVITAANYLKNHPGIDKKLPCIIVGISMGAASSLKAAEAVPGLCDAMIIDSTYARLDSTILKAFALKSSLPRYPFFPIIKYMFHYFAGCDVQKMNPVESVKKIQEPILFIHSCDDTFISVKNAIKLYSNAQNKKSKLWIGPRCRHGWLQSHYKQEYKRKVDNFLKKALPAF